MITTPSYKTSNIYEPSMLSVLPLTNSFEVDAAYARTTPLTIKSSTATPDNLVVFASATGLLLPPQPTIKKVANAPTKYNFIFAP